MRAVYQQCARFRVTPVGGVSVLPRVRCMYISKETNHLLFTEIGFREKAYGRLAANYLHRSDKKYAAFFHEGIPVCVGGEKK